MNIIYAGLAVGMACAIIWLVNIVLELLFYEDDDDGDAGYGY